MSKIKLCCIVVLVVAIPLSCDTKGPTNKGDEYVIETIAQDKIYSVIAVDSDSYIGHVDFSNQLTAGLKELARKYEIVNVIPVASCSHRGGLAKMLIVKVKFR